MQIFEWDKRKARENEAKHGVSFEQATQVFEDPQLVLAEDAATVAAKRGTLHSEELRTAVS
jgi:uncharacterized protein